MLISGCGMLIRGVVKFSARNCPGINFKKVGNYVYTNMPWHEKKIARQWEIFIYQKRIIRIYGHEGMGVI